LDSLQTYAEQLTREQARLAWYRAELRMIAAELSQGRIPPEHPSVWLADEGHVPIAGQGLDVLTDAATFSS